VSLYRKLNQFLEWASPTKPAPSDEHLGLKPYEKLQKYWRENNAGMETIELSPSQVEGLESRYGIHLPEDFRDYLLHSCTRDDSGFDNNLTTWWALGQIKTIFEERNLEIAEGRIFEITYEVVARDSSKYLIFADYMFWCWAWAICCDDGEN